MLVLVLVLVLLQALAPALALGAHWAPPAGEQGELLPELRRRLAGHSAGFPESVGEELRSRVWSRLRDQVTFPAYVAAHPDVCPGVATENCTILLGADVVMDQSATLRSLTVLGSLTVRPGAGQGHLTLTTAFVLVYGRNARLTMDATQVPLTVFLRRDSTAFGDVPPGVAADLGGGGRFLGAYGGQVTLMGRPTVRTWTLLTQRANKGDSTLIVAHDVSDWQEGSEIAIAPTDLNYGIDAQSHDTQPTPYRVGPEVFKIVSIQNGGTHITLNATIRNSFFQGDVATGIQAEVMLLTRSLLITGDPFMARYAPLPPNHWFPFNVQKYANSDAPVEGLHTFQAYSGVAKYSYIRVELAGQRGCVGRYPIHLHMIGDCPTCEVVGNAVVYSQQRGLTIHATHRALVHDNVLFGVKGAGLYIEDGTEMDNLLKDNVVLCDAARTPGTYFWNGKWNLIGTDPCAVDLHDNSGIGQEQWGDPGIELGGCRVLGTDNNGADCEQQAGLWSLSASNSFIGNRVSNVYNGLYWQSTAWQNGRFGERSLHYVCPESNPFGVVRDNVAHTCGRFGFYPDENWPRNLNRNVSTNGYVWDILARCPPIHLPNVPYWTCIPPPGEQPYPCMDNVVDLSAKAWCSCRAMTVDGKDNGQFPPGMVEGQLDYGVQYVGQYDLSDVAYHGLRSIANFNGFYMKGTKNFVEPSTTFILNSVFSTLEQSLLETYDLAGAVYSQFLVSLPGSSSAIILENVILRGPTYVGIGLNQDAKWPHGEILPSGGVPPNEGALSSPEVVLQNVSFVGIVEGTTTKWLQFGLGSTSGNPYLGVVVTLDGQSLCDGGAAVASLRGGGVPPPCTTWTSITTQYQTHLLNLPGSPCVTSASLGDVWHRRFDGGIVCTGHVRRLNVWSDDQGSNLVILPPGCTQAKSCGYEMKWMTFSDPPSPSQPRQYCKGYAAMVLTSASVPGTWTLGRMDSSGEVAAMDMSKIVAIEFSDQAFGQRWPEDKLDLDLVGSSSSSPTNPCHASSLDARTWISYEGPIRRGGGSCVGMF